MIFSTILCWQLPRQLLLSAAVLALLLPGAGCRICSDCEDIAYPAYGGAWQRTRRDDGRVGSLFDPAGARASELVSRDDPLNPDQLERQLRSRRAKEASSDQQERSSDEGERQPRDRAADDPDADLRFEQKAKELRELNLDEMPIESLEQTGFLTSAAG